MEIIATRNNAAGVYTDGLYYTLYYIEIVKHLQVLLKQFNEYNGMMEELNKNGW